VDRDEPITEIADSIIRWLIIPKIGWLIGQSWLFPFTHLPVGVSCPNEPQMLLSIKMKQS
jgi:hypothetical protein